MADGQIVFEVSADGRNAIADIKDITRTIETESKKWDNAAGQSTEAIGTGFGSMLKKVAMGISVAQIGKSLLDIGKAAVSAASDLQEVQNVVDVTFGADSNKIETWAKNAGAQFGLTETQAKRFSSTMGAMLKSSGLAGAEVTEMSTTLAGLSADMASFYNMDFDEAFQKIRSGISGETEPLKQLGINMSVANLEAFALQQGLSKTFSEMDQGEQIMLRYQYLMHATADAQGDFARTSDGYANSVRMLETNLENLKTTIGNKILPVVNDLVAGINSLFSDGTNKKTVLDDFADIDAATEAKLSQIHTTADEARELADELDRIGGSSADKAGSKLQQMVAGLTSIDLDQEKAGVVKDFIDTLGKNIDIIASIQGTSNEEAKKWLDGLAESANKLDPADAEGWSKLIESIKTGLPGLENTDFGAAFFAALGDGFASVEEKSSVLQWAVDALGNKTNKTAQEQLLWLETCKRLVQTIPGLSSIINTETGEVKGGTQAIKDYIQAWEDGQAKLAMMQAVEEKSNAIASRFSDLPGLQLDMALAKRRVRKMQEELAKEFGATFNGSSYVGGAPVAITNDFGIVQNQDEIDRWHEAYEEYTNLVEAEKEATNAYNTQKDALDEAQQALKEYEETIAEMPGAIEESADATEDWIAKTGKTKEEIQSLVETAKEAIGELNEYVANVRESTYNEISGTVKGFEEIKTIDKQLSELELKKGVAQTEEEVEKLNEQMQQIKGNRPSVQNMQVNLRDQLEYMDKYLEYLQQAREKGASDEILSGLTDGSVESYEYLKALAEGTPEQVRTLNNQYQAVIDKKKEMTEELSNQKLTADEAYKSLADAAKEAVAALDLESTASENTGKTVGAIATAISDHVGEVQSAVDSILSELNRLDSWGISIDLGGFGSINISGNTGTAKSHMMGLDYVPFDDYIARLHEGEAVLTAEENRVWQGLHNGGLANVDLDALGGVMQDNIKPGGNVYLDGKIVGAVVSDRQGRNYRNMQRSGWQT